MKVLFINNFKGPDYLNDTIYHGLIDCGYDVYETNMPHYMLSSYKNVKSLYGRGFTVFGKLQHTPKVEDDYLIYDKIMSKFYDIIIYGSIHRDIRFLDAVKKSYKKDCVNFLDGEDHTSIKEELLNIGRYWKRECLSDLALPISFSIPESQLCKFEPDKKDLFSHIVPGELKTYIYEDEESYYNGYRISYYGITKKKGGWDCMRHYEILANKSIPYFIDLKDCPKNIMKSFPKEIILETNEYASNNRIHPDYSKLNEELFNYTKSNLTTKAVAKKIILT